MHIASPSSGVRPQEEVLGPLATHVRDEANGSGSRRSRTPGVRSSFRKTPLMRSAGYPLGASLSFLLTRNLGGAVGALGGAVLADRYGIKLAVVYSLVLLAGVGTTGTQILLSMLIGGHYPAWSRATGLGVGRIGAIVGPTYGDVLVAIGTGTSWQIAAFAAPAVVGAILTVVVPQRTPIRRFAQARRPSAAAGIDRKAVS